ncbi:nuclear GTPase SLIP-GC-like isoform X2 [Toxotes jaculatrix]|uniref:nuclear GTPase SLIP-GC-like isoform X2 n=1 Tax=Toxotes jaculatrix TaxID=941984 RepID=UPI001B3A8430|nr:nuclear GTPase SLIP-GC-like isoform X2 [Toxotes jaculatrix]
MDDFVRKKLTEWGLRQWIEKFEDEGIDTEALYCLNDQDIDNLIPKVGPRAKLRKMLELLKEEQNSTNQETEVDLSADEDEEAADCTQVLPPTNDANDKAKRRLDLQGEPSKQQSPAGKRRCDKPISSYKEKFILADVNKIMKYVDVKIQHEDNTKFNAFLKTKICDLETDKREVVGVFGKTGAGKSSLINAVIEEKNLLPSGSISACTSVMIKLESNMRTSKYEADIEFITEEEWKDELWSLYHILKDNANQEKNDDDYKDAVDKLSALYGEEWKNISFETLMDYRHFREIPEFLQSKRKILTCETAAELSAKFVKYTRNDSREDTRRWYWPLVKCVTVRVPSNHLLQHVTLVDLPGNGDCNRSRDRMWKEIVGSCSTVWIVTDINRAAAETEPWEILQNASSLMGNGGECQRIHFICTKSDLAADLDDDSAAAVRASIFKRNMDAKEQVIREFKKRSEITKHFSGDCFRVFTVSSKEFLKPKRLQPDETEIPRLQEFLQNLNDCHSETLNYVSGAHGILSLIQGARCREVAGQKADVCAALEENLRRELDKVRKAIEEAYEAFERRLVEGVEKSKSSCENSLKSVLYGSRARDRGFHRTLKCVVANSGSYKTQKRRQINLNEKLSSCLSASIDEEFRNTFPNEGKCGPFKGVIKTFSLDTERLIQKYKDVELQLIFLKTEEEKIKTKVNKNIRERKKIIYHSLSSKIQELMQECYDEAAKFRGTDTLKNMRQTIEKHVHESKNTMFEVAKNVMLDKLNKLKGRILEELEKTLKQSIELSLKTDDYSIPDFSAELDMVKRHYDELKLSSDGEMSLTGTDQPGPSSAL